MMFLQRSCVSGRDRFMLCMCITIDSASGWPIQIGSRRAPPFSCSTTTYACVPGSMPSRDTCTSIMRHLRSAYGTRERGRPVGALPRKIRHSRFTPTDTFWLPAEVSVGGRRAVDGLAQIEGIDDTARGEVERIPHRLHDR